MKHHSDNRRRTPLPPLVLASVTVVALVAVGLVLGYGRLRDLWLEQCVVENMSEQVRIQSDNPVIVDLLKENFGLRKGVNLAHIDFAARRAEVLAKIPNLKSLAVTRQLPDRVTIVAEEREPVAQLDLVRAKRRSGKVLDAEGMVFFRPKGTQMLPVIREPNAPGTAVGRCAAGRTQAALQVVEACRDPEFQEFGLQEIDVSHKDYLVLTLDPLSYARVKLAWQGMDDEPSPESRSYLSERLTRLRDAIRTHLGDETVIWNAADLANPGRVYADMKGKF